MRDPYLLFEHWWWLSLVHCGRMARCALQTNNMPTFRSFFGHHSSFLNLHHARSYLCSCGPGWNPDRWCMLYVPPRTERTICLRQNKTGELYTREHELSVSAPSLYCPPWHWYVSRLMDAFLKGPLPPARVVSRRSFPRQAQENSCPVLST